MIWLCVLLRYSLPGTIHSAADEIRAAGGRALAVECDIRYEDQVSANQRFSDCVIDCDGMWWDVMGCGDVMY